MICGKGILFIFVFLASSLFSDTSNAKMMLKKYVSDKVFVPKFYRISGFDFVFYDLHYSPLSQKTRDLLGTEAQLYGRVF